MVEMDPPTAGVQAVVIYNDKDLRGNWIPLRLEVGSWVTLMPAERGPWARDARTHGDQSFVGAWKAQVMRFRWHWNIINGRRVMVLDGVLVRHAYQRQQLELDPEAPTVEPRKSNFVYTSYWEDWVSPECVLDVILVLHHEIGEALRNGRTHKQLLENGTFYLRGVYVPACGLDLYSKIEALPLPQLKDQDWPIPDMNTSESFRLKMAIDIAGAMKGGTGSKAAHVQWFMPIHVMVDLFAKADTMRRTATMYVFKDPSSELFASLMDCGWDEKWQRGQDIIKCIVSRDNMVFRYHVARQMLYATFSYVRYRSERQGWIAMDQVEIPNMVSCNVMFGDEELPVFEVGSLWPVSHIRDEIAILLPIETIPENYDLFVSVSGQVDKKVCFGIHLPSKLYAFGMP